MKSLELNTFGVIELDCKQLQEITGGVNPWWSVVGPIIEATVRVMAACADAYVNYSANTGGSYVIHHAY